MSKNMKWTLGLLAVGCMLAMAAPATAEMMDSADFGDNGGWMYEMYVDPVTQDLNSGGSGNKDFRYKRTSGTKVIDDVNGIMTITSSTGDHYLFDAADLNTNIWQEEGFVFAAGYTIEFSLEIDPLVDEGTLGVFTVFASQGDGGKADLTIAKSGQFWGSTALGTGTYDNTDDQHVFRIAMEAGETPGTGVFNVWRDGVPLNDTPLGYAGVSGSNRVIYGDAGSSWKGKCDLDYFRFIKGEYAPIPEPSTLILLVGGLLSLVLWRRR